MRVSVTSAHECIKTDVDAVAVALDLTFISFLLCPCVAAAPFARLLRIEKINDIRYGAAANHSSSNQTSRLRALR